MEFIDRILVCADCNRDFVFTAGEQLFFFDKQFRNDPKRCKPCKSRRSGAVSQAGAGPVAAGISRTETRTTCSACNIETTVPFKPTQGRPVLCRQCFQQHGQGNGVPGTSPGSSPSMAAGQPGTLAKTRLAGAVAELASQGAPQDTPELVALNDR